MVFFTCGGCNETLKKNKVDQHFESRCKNTEFVSCVDCSKDFYGDDYSKHTSCISEAEKYGGKDFTAPSNTNKGQRKQEEWFDKVQRVLENAATSDVKLKDILENLTKYPNVPRKKPKFINFLKSTFPRYRNQGALMEQVWKLLEESVAQQPDITAMKPAPKGAETDTKGMKNNGEDEAKENTDDEMPAKQSKPSKRKKNSTEEEQIITEQEVEEIREKKRRKREQKENNNLPPEQENVERLNDTLEVKEKGPRDFCWPDFIKAVIHKKGEISIKKLRKLALAEYTTYSRPIKSEEGVFKKLDKKLRSMDDIQIIKEKVSFKSS